LVDTQNEVVKEKRLRVDNQPYWKLLAEVKKNITKHLSLGNYWFYEPSRRRDFKIQALTRNLYSEQCCFSGGDFKKSKGNGFKSILDQ
jgi:hypothetical protein